jgi:hypothetical protein
VASARLDELVSGMLLSHQFSHKVAALSLSHGTINLSTTHNALSKPVVSSSSCRYSLSMMGVLVSVALPSDQLLDANITQVVPRMRFQLWYVLFP